MNFNSHYHLTGKHAFLSASQYHWIRYEDEKFDNTYKNRLEAQRGSQFHELAAELIRLGVKLPRTAKTINAYVNDAISFKMTPEQILFYSENAFGTADAIMFRDNVLRIHDLKTGINKASFDQLRIYVAFFCLEYKYDPKDLQIILRIYQNDDVQELIPDPEEIYQIMRQLIKFDNRIRELEEALT